MKHHIEANTVEPVKPEVPDFTSVIEGYMYALGYTPATVATPPQKVMVKTSQDIIADLAEMVDMSLNDTAAAMTHLGYITGSKDGRIGWMLQITHHVL